MIKVYSTGKLTAMSLCLVLLAGCSVMGGGNVAIEDRSINGQGNNTQWGSQSSSEVEVTALNVRPKFKASNTSGEALNSEVSRQTKAAEVATKAQNPATIALISTAHEQARSGSLRSAQSSLERALRIAPKDPEVYLSLGEVHRQLGEYIQAEQMVLKGIAVAAGQSRKLRSLWSALAKIRSEAGDSAGANQAFQKSQSY